MATISRKRKNKTKRRRQRRQPAHTKTAVPLFLGFSPKISSAADLGDVEGTTSLFIPRRRPHHRYPALSSTSASVARLVQHRSHQGRRTSDRRQLYAVARVLSDWQAVPHRPLTMEVLVLAARESADLHLDAILHALQGTLVRFHDPRERCCARLMISIARRSYMKLHRDRSTSLVDCQV